MIWWGREGDEWHTAEDGGDSCCFPDMGGKMIDAEGVQWEETESEVKERRVCSLSIALKCFHRGVGTVVAVLLTSSDNLHEPALQAANWHIWMALFELYECMVEQDGDGLARRSVGE